MVLLEVALHNPIAAAIGRQGESEMALVLLVAKGADPNRLAGAQLRQEQFLKFVEEDDK